MRGQNAHKSGASLYSNGNSSRPKIPSLRQLPKAHERFNAQQSDSPPLQHHHELVPYESKQEEEEQQQQQVQKVEAENQMVRSYADMMESFQTQFVVKKGKVVENSPEFVQFKRGNITRWGAISLIIHMIEKMLEKYNVTFAYVDGKSIAALSEEELRVPTEQDLFECIVNKDQVGEQMRNPQNKYQGVKGPLLAAVCIQKYWRRFKAYTAYSQLKFLMTKATIIQRKYRLYQLMKSTRAKIKQLAAESLQVWREMMAEFKTKWSEIKRKKRIEIHINSYSIAELKRTTIEKFKQKENAQISRIFSIKDPKVEVIYISPFTLTKEVYEYYRKLIQLGELEDPESRFHVIVPENYVKFHAHMSLTQTLLYSSKAIKRIKHIISGQQAYIVPGMVDQDDIRLSIALGVPIMAGEPQYVNIFSTKSGAKRIFQQADVPTPISAYDIYDQLEFQRSLAKLIAHNLNVNTWVFKIDDEFNGRGHASLSVENIKPVIELRKKKIEITESLVERLLDVVKKVLPRKVKIAMPSLYHSWNEYMEAFCKVGGVIEAAPYCKSSQVSSPSISFFVEPDGNVDLVGSFDRFSAHEFVNVGCFFPQTSLSSMVLLPPLTQF